MKKQPEQSKKENSTLSKVDQADYWANEKEYELDENHPHRQYIVDIVRKFDPVVGVLEVGCNVGQNLKLIQEVFPETQMAGVDINATSIDKALVNVPKAILQTGNATNLSFVDKSFDIILADAVLMYVEDIGKALNEMARVARKGLIIVDWQSEKETLIGHSIARDYEKLLSEFGKVESIKITKEIWPNTNWEQYGHIFVCRLV